MFNWLESILSSPVGSIEGLREEPLLAAFCTRKLELEALPSDGGVVTVSDSSASSLIFRSSCLDVPQPHFCFLGIAAVTAPHEHDFEDG